MRASGVRSPGVEHDQAPAVAPLSPLHRDPIGRLRVAQALAPGAELVTADTALTAYPARVRLVGR